MKRLINILILEDNIYYNELLITELKNYILKDWLKREFKFVFQSFTDVEELISRIRSNDFSDYYSLAFIDYYLGNSINGSHVIKILKEQSPATGIILLSHSEKVRQIVDPTTYDYFILKDTSAIALCRLCLEQYLDNRFLVNLFNN
jgi:hypothetical protein